MIQTTKVNNRNKFALYLMDVEAIQRKTQYLLRDVASALALTESV